MGKVTSIQIPVLIGENYRYVMGSAEMIEGDDSFEVQISVTTTGTEARDLIAVLTSDEPKAVQFVAIPVVPRSTKSQENI